MRYTGIILILVLGVIVSCVDPLDINIDKEENILIVEGAITTLPGPHIIRLTLSAKYGSIFDGYIRPLTSADVIIRDSDGINYELIEDKENASLYYTPPEFQAAVGKTYTLLIRTLQGQEYTSLPEKIIKATPIDSLSARFKSTPTAEGVNSTGLEVFSTFQDNPDTRNYFMWRNSATYKIETYPENFMTSPPEGGPAIIPAPKSCCRDCWVDERNNKTLRIFSDENVNGNSVTQLVTYVSDDGVRYTEKYLIRVEQHTLTQKAYQFFKLLEQQASISGDIFDPPPATLRGNMINLTNPDENVIGYFRASDVSIDSMFLTPDMLLEPKPLKQINDDCQTFRGGDASRPSYW